MSADAELRNRALAFVAANNLSHADLSNQAVGYSRLIPFFRGVRGITAADAAALTAYLDAREADAV